MERSSASQVKDLSNVGATKTSIKVRKEAKTIQYSVLKFNTKDTKYTKEFFFKSLVTFVIRKRIARVMRSIESEAMGQAGMIHNGGRSAV